MLGVRRFFVLSCAAALLLAIALPARADVTASPGQVAVQPGELSDLVTVTIATARADPPSGFLIFDGLPGSTTTVPSPVSYTLPASVPTAMTSFQFSVPSSTLPGSYAVTITASGTAGAANVLLNVLPPPDFAITLADPVMNICAGAAPAMSSVTITPIGGYSGSPLLEWIGVPSDVQVTPPVQSSPPLPPARVIPFSVTTNGTASGTRTMTLFVRDAAQRIEKSVTLTLQVTPPGFAASVSPSAVTLTSGGSPATFTASIAPNQCLREPVTVSTTGLPSGISMSPGSAVMNLPYTPLPFTLSASAAASPGTSTVPIVFTTAAGLQQTASLTINVVAPPDFTLAVSPAALTIAAGSSATTQATLTPLHGFVGTASVTVTADADITITPASFTLSAAQPQTLQIAVSPTASRRTIMMTLQGQAAGTPGVRTAMLTINISPRPDFALTVTPPAVSVRSGSTTSVVVRAPPMNGFAQPVSVVSPSVAGISFSPSTFVLAPGAAQSVIVDATAAVPSPPIALTFAGTAPDNERRTASLLLTILARDPELLAIIPPATIAGAFEQRFRVTGEFLQEGALFTFDDPRVRLTGADVLTPGLADIIISTHADTPAGAYLLRVTNPDGGRSATTVPLLVYPPTSLRAPLGITAASIVFPASGSAIANGESVYPRGLLATSGAGTILGSWQLDGVPFDRFTAIATGGMPIEVRAHVPIPTSWAGGHRLELIIETPAQVSAPAIEVVQTTVRASRLTQLAPRDGAVLAARTSSLFRWSLVPNCGGYLIEIVDDATARSGLPVELLPVRRFRVAEAEWQASAEEIRQIGFGIRRWRVSPVCAGETIAEPTPWRRFAFLPDTISLELAPLTRASDGKVALRWSPGPAGLLYRVEVLSADGAPIFAALTPRTEYILDPLLVQVPGDGSVRITAIAPGGVILGTSAAQRLPQSRLRSPSIYLAQLSTFSLLQTEPRDGARVTTPSPRISANWREPVRPDQVSMMLDSTDVTFVSTVTPTSIIYDSLLPIEPGSHTARLSVAGQMKTWTFVVDTAPAATTPDAASAETPADAAASADAKKNAVRTDWAVSPVGTITSVRDAKDDARLQISAQTDLAGASTSMKVTGDLGVKHELDDPNRTVQESRSWVTQFGAHQGTTEEEVTVGYTQPDFMDQAQLVSAGLARGGAQAKLKSRAGTVSYYQTFGTRPVGVVAGNVGPEQTLRAIAYQLPSSGSWDFRLIALDVEDEAGFNSAGGEGRALGLFTRYTFGPAASLIVEAARGRFEPNPGSAVTEREGNAFRASLSGLAAGTSYVLNLRRTDSDFVNPANRGFTAGGIPDRSGGDLLLSRLFGMTALSAQVRYLRDGTSSGQILPSTSERGAVVSLTTPFGSHVFFSLMGNLTEQRGDAAPAISLPETDRRQSGAAATFSETFGRFSTSQTLQWQKMEDAISPLAQQTLKAATLTAAGALHPNFNLSAVLSGTRSEGAESIGRTDQMLASLQPMLSIPSIWVSVQPRAMWSRTKGSLTGFETKSEQYAMLLSFSPPIGKSILALQVSSDWSRNRFTGQGIDAPFIRRYAATLSLVRSFGSVAAPSMSPETMPYLAPSDSRSGQTTPPLTGGVR